MLDGKWRFYDHFRSVAEKADRVAGVLSCIMPNLNGPLESRRRLYMNVIHSVLFYGAPVWSSVMEKKYARSALQKVQRRIAMRVICSYSTVSHVATGMLTRAPPIDLLALKVSKVYFRVRELRAAGATVMEQALRAFAAQANEELLVAWRNRLATPITAECEAEDDAGS